MNTVVIYPELEKFQKVSSLWTYGMKEGIPIEILEEDHQFIEKLIRDLDISDTIDNLCFLLLCIKNEKDHIDHREKLKSHHELRKEDRLNVAKYLQAIKQFQEWTEKVEAECSQGLKQFQEQITVIGYTNALEQYRQILEQLPTRTQWERRIPTFDKVYFKYKNQKGGLSIQHPDIIEKLMGIIISEYKYQSSTQEDFKDKLKIHEKINDPTDLRRCLAKKVYDYLSNNTNLGKRSQNDRYYSIGLIFKYTGVESGLDEEDYDQKKDESSYKNYRDYVVKKIGGRYF